MKKESKAPKPEEVKYLQDALYVIGGKWKLPILHCLGSGVHKFSELQRNIPNITPRMLAKDLKELELNGFINRTVLNDLIDYEVTAYCKSFEKIIKEMISWGKAHRSYIRSRTQDTLPLQ